MRRNVGSPPGLSVENVVLFFTFFNLTNAMYDSELCQCIERMGSISQRFVFDRSIVEYGRYGGPVGTYAR